MIFPKSNPVEFVVRPDGSLIKDQFSKILRKQVVVPSNESIFLGAMIQILCREKTGCFAGSTSRGVSG